MSREQRERNAWEAGFRLCRAYGDNHPHFDGEQKERQWQAYWRTVSGEPTPPATPQPVSPPPASGDVEKLHARVREYLQGGGLFNPELARHDAVRDLIMTAARAAERQQHQQEIEREKRENFILNDVLTQQANRIAELKTALEQHQQTIQQQAAQIDMLKQLLHEARTAGASSPTDGGN